MWWKFVLWGTKITTSQPCVWSLCGLGRDLEINLDLLLIHFPSKRRTPNKSSSSTIIGALHVIGHSITPFRRRKTYCKEASTSTLPFLLQVEVPTLHSSLTSLIWISYNGRMWSSKWLTLMEMDEWFLRLLLEQLLLWHLFLLYFVCQSPSTTRWYFDLVFSFGSTCWIYTLFNEGSGKEGGEFWVNEMGPHWPIIFCIVLIFILYQYRCIW